MNCANCQKPVKDEDAVCEYCGAGVIHLSSDRLSKSRIKRVGSPGYVCFVPNNNQTEISIFEEPDIKSIILYELGKGEPVPIVTERENWFEVLLPAGESGFVLKNAGRKLEISAEQVTNPLGFYRVNTNKKIVEYVTTDGLYGSKGSSQRKETNLKAVKVYALPDVSSSEIYSLPAEQCIPIVEDREGWFKIQFDEGVRGFVQKEDGIRTMRKDSIPFPYTPDASKLGSSVFGGIAKVIGTMVSITALAGFNQGMKDINSN